MVGDSEREDFEQAIRDKGFDLDDFELIENRDPPRGGEVHAITGTLTIKRRSTGLERTYQAGYGSAWPAEFSDDLNNGVFG